MRGILSIFLYFYTSSGLIKWLALLGVGLIILQAFITVDEFSLLSSVMGFGLALATPLVAAPYAFRQLISNRRLSIIPNFNLSAGFALLPLVVLTSVYIPLASRLFGDGSNDIAFVVSLGVFAGISLYIGLAQLLSPTKYGMQSLAFVPIIWLTFIQPVTGQIASFLLEPIVMIGFFIFAVVGWCYGLRLLAIKTNFKAAFMPAHMSVANTTGQAWSGTGGSFFIGTKGTPGGTLLLRSPDGLLGMAGLSLTQVILGPLAIIICITFLGFQAEDKPESSFAFIEAFLLASIYVSSFSLLGCSEMMARARLIWLRQPGDRDMIWGYLERIFIKRLSMTYLFVLLVAISLAVLSDIAVIVLLHYLLIIISMTLASLYFSALFRVKGWHEIAMGLLMIPAAIILLLGIFKAYNTGEYDLIISIEASFLVLAGLVRHFARQAFNGVDWCNIKPVFRTSRAAIE